MKSVSIFLKLVEFLEEKERAICRMAKTLEKAVPIFPVSGRRIFVMEQLLNNYERYHNELASALYLP